MALTDIRPLRDDLPYGVRVGGLTREAIADPAVRRQVEALFLEHGMILFEGIEQSDEMQVAVSTIFGPLKEHPVKAVARVDGNRLPGVIEIRSEPGKGILEIEGRRVSHWQPWHFDHCYNNELNRAGVLRPVHIVEEGGVTGFLDGIALYEAFPQQLRDRLDGHEVLYRLDTQYDDLRFGVPADYRMIEPKPITPEFVAQANAMARAIHPAIWTRSSGEKVLHVSSYMSQGLVGEENPQGDALLEEACQEINRLAGRLSYQHQWRPDDMIVWDNTRMLHKVSGNHPDAFRLMYRTTISGDYGLGRWETETTGTQAVDAMA